MRTNIDIAGIRHLQYEIREIADYGRRLVALGVPMTWENIGDPVAAGEEVSPWIRDIVSGLVLRNESWAYCQSRGVPAAREFLASVASARPGGIPVFPDDILFFNGIADAVDKVYDLIRRDARVLMQAPSYPTHTSNEAKRSEYDRIQFHLDPRNNWLPDLEEIENKVKFNPQVVAIAIVNPDNPTGMVYPRETLEAIVEIARRYRLFLICDEIYAHICYNGASTLHLSQVIGDVPALVLRGISKDYPWPGARCGWAEMLNRDKDPAFDEYCKTLLKAKMLEVCSTTLPQMSIPLVYGDPRYMELKERRAKMFEKRANDVYDFFHGRKYVEIQRARGAFYCCITFPKGVLNDHQTLPVGDPAVRALVEEKTRGVSNDKRFAYYLMASAGVCVTPLSGFHTEIEGFRITTLRTDDKVRMETLRRIQDGIEAYVESAP